MKLKFKLVNGYGVLVDEPIFVPNAGQYMCSSNGMVIDVVTSENIDKIYPTDYKIIFAEAELGLDVPVFEWRDFEVKNLATLKAIEHFPYTEEGDVADCIDAAKRRIYKLGFIEAHKLNTARYTEEDLIDAIVFGMVLERSKNDTGRLSNEKEVKGFIQSLKKYPQYVVMETECCGKCIDGLDECLLSIKLFINSQGKKQGIVKELIW